MSNDPVFLPLLFFSLSGIERTCTAFRTAQSIKVASVSTVAAIV